MGNSKISSNQNSSKSTFSQPCKCLSLSKWISNKGSQKNELWQWQQSGFKYLALTIRGCHNPSWVSSFHHYLVRKVIYCLPRSNTPRPPLFLDRHITFRLTIWFFFFKLPVCQKNLLRRLSNLPRIVLLNKNIDMTKEGTADKLALTRINLPPKDAFPFHASTFLTIFPSRKSQS